MVGVSTYTMNISIYIYFAVKEISIMYRLNPSVNSFSVSMIIRYMGMITCPMDYA